MHVEVLERRWIWIVALLVAVMLSSIVYTALLLHAKPPSNVEVIDSTRLHLTDEFAEDNLGVKTHADGSVTVTMVAHRYGFSPRFIELPAGKPVTLRVATSDVLHGLHIPGTNIDTMVVPGFVSEVKATVDYQEARKYGVLEQDGSVTLPLYCNEFCGLNHHYMWAKVRVRPDVGGKGS
jgi:cytochrome c oxidase subunit II